MIVFDITRVSSAIFHDRIARALVSSVFLLGALIALASLIAVFPEGAILGAFVALFWGGILLLLTRSKGVIAMGLATLLLFCIGALFFVDGIVTPLRPRLFVPLDVTGEAQGWASVADELMAALPWRIAGAVAGFVSILLGQALLAQAFRRFRLNRIERPLLPQRAGFLGEVLDLPVGVPAYFRDAWVSFALIFSGILFLAFATINILLVNGIRNLGAVNAAVICGETESESFAACFIGQGWAAALGMPLMLVFSFVVLPVIGSALVRLGRSRAAKSAAGRFDTDTRAPLLFLRSFENMQRQDDNQVRLEEFRPGPLGFALRGFRGAKPLDYLLVEHFMADGPIRALGRPGDKVPPYGALRIYATNDQTATSGPDELRHWQTLVLEQAEAAHAIILVFDPRIAEVDKGIAWEVATIAGRVDLREKTVFLAHPALYELPADDRVALWHRITDAPGFPAVDAPAADWLALSSKGTETVAVTVSCHPKRTHYITALRYLLR